MNEQMREYAKREAEHLATYNPERKPSAVIVDCISYGILHLADRLNDPDVIEAGMRGAALTSEGFKTIEDMNRAKMGAALAAMFAKISEGEQ